MLASIIGSILIFCIAVFYFLLSLGFPLGEFSWGGKFSGTLPLNLRISCGVSIVFQIFAIAVLLQGGKIIYIGLADSFIKGSVWFFAGFFTLNTVMNILSKSKKERYLMTPIALVISCCFWITVISM